ncbi:MAG: hypothetical protein WCJ30_15825 [Deltaproteobacteria bacterium]
MGPAALRSLVLRPSLQLSLAMFLLAGRPSPSRPGDASDAASDAATDALPPAPPRVCRAGTQ